MAGIFKRNSTARLLMALFAALIALCGLMNSRAGAQNGQATALPERSQRTSAAMPSQSQSRPLPRSTPAPLRRPAPVAQPTPPPDDDEDVVRVNTNLTNILFTAVDNNQRFITMLRREDVRVLEDGTPQTLNTFQREADLPLTLALLIDTSASQEKVLPDEKAAARTFVDAVMRPEKDRVAVISFTGEARLEGNLTGQVTSVRDAIDRVNLGLSAENLTLRSINKKKYRTFDEDPTGYTGVWDAIWNTTNEVLSKAPEQTRRAIILLSDGDDTSSYTKRQEAIDFAIKNNVVVYSIGIRDENFREGKMDVGALRKVSENTGGRVFFPVDKSELDAAFAQIEQELRSQYIVANSPTNKNFNGAFRQVRLEIVNPELRKQKLRLLYRQGYYARSAATPAAVAAPVK